MPKAALPVVAVVVPGRTRARILVGRGDRLLLSFAGPPSPEGVAHLLSVAFFALRVECWMVAASGFRRGLLEAEAVRSTCVELGIVLRAMELPSVSA